MDDKNLKPWLVPEYLSESEIATVMGRSRGWLKVNRLTLEREGFPTVDALVGLTCRQDVLAWIKRRRRVADVTEVEAREIAKGDGPDTPSGINFGNL